MKSLIVENMKESKDIKVSIDEYGCVYLGDILLSCDDLQLISNASLSIRVANFITDCEE